MLVAALMLLAIAPKQADAVSQRATLVAQLRAIDAERDALESMSALSDTQQLRLRQLAGHRRQAAEALASLARKLEAPGANTTKNVK